MLKRIITYLVIATAVLTAGCTRENLEDCYSGLELDFEFSHNTDETNYFGPDVNRVRVYLFDENGVLKVYAVDNGITLDYKFVDAGGTIKSVSKPNLQGALNDDYVMRLDIPAGKYKVMSWAGSGTGDQTTFFHGHMNDPVTHNFERDVTLGVTTAENFRMFVDYNNADEWPQDIIPVVPEIYDLFYGAVGTRHPQTSAYTFKTVEVTLSSITKEHIELIRNTNILDITITGAKYTQPAVTRGSPTSIADSPFTLYVQGQNGRYKWDNSIGDYARSIRYVPYTSEVNDDEDKITAKVKVLRLDWNKRDTDTRMVLYFENSQGVRYPNNGIDVVKTLLQAKDGNGNYIYNNQADLDKIYEHPIEIRIGADLQVRILIQGWEIVNVVPVS